MTLKRVYGPYKNVGIIVGYVVYLYFRSLIVSAYSIERAVSDGQLDFRSLVVHRL